MFLVFSLLSSQEEKGSKDEISKSTAAVKTYPKKSKKTIKKSGKKDKYVFKKNDGGKYKFDVQGNPIKEKKKKQKKSRDYINKTEATKPFSVYKFDENGNPINVISKEQKKVKEKKDELKIGSENLKIKIDEKQ